MFRHGNKFLSKILRVRHNGLFKPHSMRYAKKTYAETSQPVTSSSSSKGVKYTVGILTALGTVTIGYAKLDNDFRKYLAKETPFVDNFMKVIFQEEKSYYEYLSELFSKKETETLNKNQVVTLSQSKTETDKESSQPSKNQDVKNIDKQKVHTILKSEENLNITEVSNKPIEKDSHSFKPKLKNILEVESQISKIGDDAITAYNHAIMSLREYTSDVCSVIDDSFEKIDSGFWTGLKKKLENKKKFIEIAEKSAKEARDHIRKLKIQLNEHNFEATEAKIALVKNHLNQIETDIKDAKQRFLKEYNNINITEKYWNKVEEARNFFSRELQILYPNINVSDQKMGIAETEFDLFIMHAFAKILFYQKELIKMQTLGEARLKAALEEAKQGEDGNLWKEQIQTELEDAKRNLEIEYQKKVLSIKADADREIRNQLKRQSEAHSDHLNDALQVREQELERDFKHRLDEKLVQEQLSYKSQLAAMIGRLQGMDEALKVRADADRSAHQAQVLWATCQTLYNSVRGGTPGTTYVNMRPLRNEICAVCSASAQGDELVTTVVAGIPPEAVERGVYPEHALRERFINVERLARRLALVPENGGRLPLFLLSYIQSLLTIRTGIKIPYEEINDEKVDFSELDTYDILQRAKYWLDRGDFPQTLKYMNLLKGASRIIAREWMNEARILVETQQAAITLMAHAASSGHLI